MQINGNNAYVEWDGQDLKVFWAGEVSHERTSDGEDITSGSGATHIARASKLKDGTLDLYIIHDDTQFNTYRNLLEEGKIAMLCYGPEDNISGKPMFLGKMRLASVGMSQSIEKNKVGYELSFEQAAKPISTLTGDLAGSFP